ncbi:MAG TPA: LacI family DNA-binding transcriptional regulator [Chthoniobacteraceae bacterium]|jgi:LacI family transcriptional regulator|nr:LacI family DNA-binding transcriptional regulator [Chthoniobacteraceae bacterium]
MKRLPLREIATRHGVSVMTVSRALREGTSVSEELRAKIRQTARELGYQYDIRVSQIMSDIRKSQSPRYHENLAFVWTHHRSQIENRFFENEFTGALQRAEALGYKLEQFRIKDESLDGSVLTRILRSRGIRGVLIAPPSAERTHPHIWLKWRELCCVLLGRSFANTGLARVQHDHYFGALLAMRRLRRLGYKQIGLVLSKSMDERSSRLVRSAFLSFQTAGCKNPASLIFTAARYESGKVADWLKRVRPDAVLVNFEEEMFPRVEHFNFRGKGSPAIAALNWNEQQPEIAGVNQHRSAIGSQAIDLLTGRLQKGQFGLDPLAPSILIPGSWTDGPSVPSNAVWKEKMEDQTDDLKPNIKVSKRGNKPA